METFPRYWLSVRGIYRSPVVSLHKGQCRTALIFSMMCAWTNCLANSQYVGDLRRHDAHYNVIVMGIFCIFAYICMFLSGFLFGHCNAANHGYEALVIVMHKRIWTVSIKWKNTMYIEKYSYSCFHKKVAIPHITKKNGFAWKGGVLLDLKNQRFRSVKQVRAAWLDLRSISLCKVFIYSSPSCYHQFIWFHYNYHTHK